MAPKSKPQSQSPKAKTGLFCNSREVCVVLVEISSASP